MEGASAESASERKKWASVVVSRFGARAFAHNIVNTPARSPPPPPLPPAQPSLDKLTASIAARGAQIDAARAAVNAVTDGIFGEFCASHGLGSVRDYEVAVVERGEADAKLKRTLTDTLTKIRMKLEYTRGCVRLPS